MDISSFLIIALGKDPGLGVYVALAIVAASIIDAVFPQPGPGSPWLPLRKLISFIALSVNHAESAGQPTLKQWAIATLTKLAETELKEVIARRVAEAVATGTPAPVNVVNTINAHFTEVPAEAPAHDGAAPAPVTSPSS